MFLVGFFLPRQPNSIMLECQRILDNENSGNGGLHEAWERPGSVLQFLRWAELIACIQRMCLTKNDAQAPPPDHCWCSRSPRGIIKSRYAARCHLGSKCKVCF